jgi:hypothetical protein
MPDNDTWAFGEAKHEYKCARYSEPSKDAAATDGERGKTVRLCAIRAVAETVAKMLAREIEETGKLTRNGAWTAGLASGICIAVGYALLHKEAFLECMEANDDWANDDGPGAIVRRLVENADMIAKIISNHKESKHG